MFVFYFNFCKLYICKRNVPELKHRLQVTIYALSSSADIEIYLSGVVAAEVANSLKQNNMNSSSNHKIDSNHILGRWERHASLVCKRDRFGSPLRFIVSVVVPTRQHMWTDYKTASNIVFEYYSCNRAQCHGGDAYLPFDSRIQNNLITIIYIHSPLMDSHLCLRVYFLERRIDMT